GPRVGNYGLTSKSCTSRWLATWTMAAAPAPDERMPMLVPVGRRLGHRAADLLPRLEPPALQGQRPQHLPPRLDQVEVRRVLRLEDELPPRAPQREQEHVGRPVRLKVINDRIDPSDIGRDPRLDALEEVGPVGGAAAGIRVGQGLAG